MTDLSLLVERALAPVQSGALKRWGAPILSHEAILARVGATQGIDPQLVEARVQKAVLLELDAQLAADPSLNRQFKPTPDTAWVAKLVKRARLMELKRVHITRRASRSSKGYDITELVSTFYGRQVLEKLSFNTSRRRVVDAAEMETIRAAFLQIKLTLPEVVERTTTEKFFDPQPDDDP